MRLDGGRTFLSSITQEKNENEYRRLDFIADHNQIMSWKRQSRSMLQNAFEQQNPLQLLFDNKFRRIQCVGSFPFTAIKYENRH